MENHVLVFPEALVEFNHDFLIGRYFSIPELLVQVLINRVRGVFINIKEIINSDSDLKKLCTKI